MAKLMVFRKTMSLIVVGLLCGAVSCFPAGERLSRTDTIVDKRIPSPDGSKVFLAYRFDAGALGYTSEREVLVPACCVNGDLEPYRIPTMYEAVGWERDGSFDVAVNVVECIREHEDCSKTSDSFDGILLNVRRIDETAGIARRIEADLLSPDGRRRLVAYRYPREANLGRVHVSIIGRSDPIPRYGNFYIADLDGDGFLGAHWQPDSWLIFITSPSQSYLLQHRESFIANAPKVRYSVDVDPNARGYLWLKELPASNRAAPERRG